MEVRDEVLAGGDRPGTLELSQAIAEGWIEVAVVGLDASTFPDLDAGEASTLALASGRPGRCLVLMDEPLGRAHARLQGLAVAGLAGVLLAAKRAGFVPEVRPCFQRLKSSGFRLSEEVIRTVLAQAGEAGQWRRHD